MADMWCKVSRDCEEDLFSFMAHTICRTKQVCQWCTSWQDT